MPDWQTTPQWHSPMPYCCSIWKSQPGLLPAATTNASTTTSKKQD
ncbi:MAG: hypothetical protein ACK55Z_15010 [bacterium]